MGRVLADELGHAFDEEIRKLRKREAGSLLHEGLPLCRNLFGVLVEQSGGDGALVGKVVIEGPDGGAAAFGDGGHGCGLEAYLDEEIGGGIEEAGEAARGALLLGFDAYGI